MRFYSGISFKFRKKHLKWLFIPLLAILFKFGVIGAIPTYAYVRIDYQSPDGYVDPAQNDEITFNPADNPIGDTVTYLQNVWFYSLSQFSYLGYAKGSYLNVDADYYVTFFVPGDNLLRSYFNTDRNTLIQSNLRCAVNDSYRTGYNTSLELPNISNFNVEKAVFSGQLGVVSEVYHVTFSYRQRIPEVNYSNTNISCWFDNPNGQGLFSQHIMGSQSSQVRFGYRNVLFKASVTEDPQLSLLQGIQSSIDNSNALMQQSINIEQNTYNYITDNTEPTEPDGIDGINGILPPGPVDSLLNIPLKYLNKTVNSLTDTCQPLTFNFVFDKPITLPCFDTFYSSFPLSLKIFTEIIPCGFILILYFKHLYKKVDKATSMESDSNDEWGVI